MKYKSILSEPLVKPERDKPSLYRKARKDLDNKFNKLGRRRK